MGILYLEFNEMPTREVRSSSIAVSLTITMVSPSRSFLVGETLQNLVWTVSLSTHPQDSSLTTFYIVTVLI